SDPRPTSSIPAMRSNPASRSSRSWRMWASRGRRGLRRTVRRRPTDPFTRSVTTSAALAQGGGLADAAAQEVELGAPGDAVPDDLDLLHARRVHHEGPLNPDAAGDAAHGDLLIEAAAALAH